MGMLEKMCLLLFFIIICVSANVEDQQNESGMKEAMTVMPRRGLLSLVAVQRADGVAVAGGEAAGAGAAAGGGEEDAAGASGEGEAGSTPSGGTVVGPAGGTAGQHWHSNAPHHGSGALVAASVMITGSILGLLIWMYQLSTD
ncbi:hypothetical protein Sjap_012421 [Stephania japonica]|uniref:Uncharacterized protein n=1 Tax=Stephania japonica TaxID=461633 RepID=A0AAP0IW20_9MAGN